MSTRHGHRMVFPSPITSMPTEILLRVFQFLAADGSVSQKGARARIGHVCKQWRHISRSHASLWTRITIDAVEYDDRYGQYAADYEEAPDATFLRQSLYLSHPLPLDIRLTYTTCESRTKWEYYLPISRILEVLARYSTRWHTFEWTGPALYIDQLEQLTLRTLKSRTLQALTLRCNDHLPEPTSLHSKAIDITLGSGIKHIELNFDTPSLQPDWSKLTSLTAGFTSASLCHSVLSRTTTLEILFLTHLGVVQDPPPSNGPGPTVLRSLRHLKMTPCAITGFLNEFRFPQIEELSISEPLKAPYASHINPEFERCPNNRSDADYVNILSTFLQKPGNSLGIRRLNVVWDGALSPLFRLLETSVKALRIDFHRIDTDSARPFIQSMVISDDKPLLPNLSEIYLHESRTYSDSHFHKITQGEVLEDMILTRSDLLRVLRLTSTSSHENPNDFVQSSLCLTLQSLSSMTHGPADERLDVEWVLGNFDILREGRDYAPRGRHILRDYLRVLQSYSCLSTFNSMSTRDSRRCISSMPNEVLLWLFQLLAADGSVSSQGTRACIGRVCKRWRNISRLNRSLWTLIIIDIEEPEEDPDYFSSDEESEPDVDGPDVSFLDQSLYLSHPLPLDIRVAYRRYSDHLPYDKLVSFALTVLTRYCIRWRTFDWTSPTSFVSHLTMLLDSNLCDSNVLEALSLRCNDQNPPARSSYMLSNISLGPRTSHIEVNIESPLIGSDWSKLTSLTAGFSNDTYCHHVLSHTTGLHTLFLTHLGLEDAEDPPRKPTVLDGVRHLKLTPCAVLGFLHQFRFPQVDQLSLAEPSVPFSGHMRTDGCPHMSVTSYNVKTLCTTLELPGNLRRIRRLNIDWCTVSNSQLSTLSPLLHLFETSMTALHVEFGRGGLYGTDVFFRSLVISDKAPLLPNLSELHLTENRDPSFFTCFAGVYHGNAFEDMVLSRCNSSNIAAIPVLRMLRLHSNVSTLERERFIMSSLCLSLQSLSSTDVPDHERLDVEWMLGGVDVLREGREHARTLY